MKRNTGWTIVGAAMCFCVLYASAASPPGRFVINGDLAVDTVTRLEWQAPRDGGDVQAGWGAATAACLDAGMRLPTIKELQSIVDVRSYNPCVDTTVFPKVPSSPYWSSTLHSVGVHYTVLFGTGQYGNLQDSSVGYYRCVRALP